MKNNPFDYLRRSGMMKSDSDGGTVPQKDVYRLPVKTVSVSVKREPEAPAHTPIGPRDGWPAAKPRNNRDGWDKSGGLHIAHDGWKGKTGGDRTATEMAAAPTALVNSEASAKYVPAKKAKQEAGESKSYEKAEEKTLKGLRGSKSEVLRKGHNDMGSKKAPIGAVASAKKEVKVAKKTGGDVDAAKANVKVQKGERKAAFGELKRAQHELQAKGVGGGRKKFVKAAKANLKQNYSGAFKAQRQKAMAAERKKNEGGGFFDDITGGMASKVMGAAKKGAMPWK